jgi:uncharacterized protein with NRDE domain
MCTVTIVPLDDNGFRLVCNRDEQRTRADACPPVRRPVGGTLAAFPIDPVGGGTWIGVNDAGIGMAILNRMPGVKCSPLRAFAPARSRGLIIPGLLRHRSLDTAIEAARVVIGRGHFARFSLLIVDAHRVGVFSNDGDVLSGDVLSLSHPLLFTSSSLGDEVVEEPRRRLFESLVLKESTAWLLGQFRYHRTQWTARPDISVLMERIDSRTVSRTVIDVSLGEASLHYEPLAARDHLGQQAA